MATAEDFHTSGLEGEDQRLYRRSLPWLLVTIHCTGRSHSITYRLIPDTCEIVIAVPYQLVVVDTQFIDNFNRGGAGGEGISQQRAGLLGAGLALAAVRAIIQIARNSRPPRKIGENCKFCSSARIKTDKAGTATLLQLALGLIKQSLNV